MKNYITVLSLVLQGVKEVVKTVKEADRKQDREAIKRDVYSAWGERFSGLRQSEQSERPTLDGELPSSNTERGESKHPN